MKVKDSIAAEFDQFSGNYTEDMTKCVPHYPKLLSCFCDCLPDDFSPDAILDLGCGNGNVTALLLKEFPHAHYTLLDASAEMLALCKQRFSWNNVTCIERYFRDYDFPRCRFDLITASFSLHHLDSGEKQWIFPILFDALKPGGLFTCSDLMISKQHDQYETLCEEWRLFVDSHFPMEKSGNGSRSTIAFMTTRKIMKHKNAGCIVPDFVRSESAGTTGTGCISPR